MSLSDTKTHWPLKILGPNHSVETNEEILEFLSLYIQPSAISYLHYDSFHQFYVVFLNNIESVVRLVGKRLPYSGYKIDSKVDILPLLDYYVVKNVYPDIAKEDISDLFRPFGNVYDVKEFKITNSSKFAHVLSGNREISFLLPGYEVGVQVPGTVVALPYTFHVVKYCPACTTEGHSMLNCPDIDESTVANIVSETEHSLGSPPKLTVINAEDLESEVDLDVMEGGLCYDDENEEDEIKMKSELKIET